MIQCSPGQSPASGQDNFQDSLARSPSGADTHTRTHTHTHTQLLSRSRKLPGGGGGAVELRGGGPSVSVVYVYLLLIYKQYFSWGHHCCSNMDKYCWEHFTHNIARSTRINTNYIYAAKCVATFNNTSSFNSKHDFKIQYYHIFVEAKNNFFLSPKTDGLVTFRMNIFSVG